MWKNGAMTDLGALGLCQNSTAFPSNSKGQVVGDTGRCPNGGGPSFCLRMAMHEELALVEQARRRIQGRGIGAQHFYLVLPGYDIEVVDGLEINDRGEIARSGVLPTATFMAVLLIPASESEIAAANALNVSQATSTNTSTVVGNSENSASSSRNRARNMSRQQRCRMPGQQPAHRD